MVEFWMTAGVAALFGSAVGAFVSVWTVSRNIKHKSVIEERQRWRDALRTLLPKLVSAKRGKAREQVRDSIVLRLNPYKDQAAMIRIDQFMSDPSRAEGAEVIAHFQDLLKRDWERAKIEASQFPWCARSRSDKRVARQKNAADREAGLVPVVTTAAGVNDLTVS